MLFHTVLPSLALVLETEIECQGLCMVFLSSSEGVVLQVLTEFIVFPVLKRGTHHMSSDAMGPLDATFSFASL